MNAHPGNVFQHINSCLCLTIFSPSPPATLTAKRCECKFHVSSHSRVLNNSITGNVVPLTRPAFWSEGRSILTVSVGVVRRRADIFIIDVYELVPVVNRHGKETLYNLTKEQTNKQLTANEKESKMNRMIINVIRILTVGLEPAYSGASCGELHFNSKMCPRISLYCTLVPVQPAVGNTETTKRRQNRVSDNQD